MDSEEHRKFTGVGNERILDNLRYAARSSVSIVLRMPVVPGHNDSDENIEKTASFILNDMNNNIRQLQLLPYRWLGIEKYEALGLEYPMRDQEKPNREKYTKVIREMAEKFRSYGIPAAAGTTNKI
jgi:pyruvate formate lyase activating enzyme